MPISRHANRIIHLTRDPGGWNFFVPRLEHLEPIAGKSYSSQDDALSAAKDAIDETQKPLSLPIPELHPYVLERYREWLNSRNQKYPQTPSAEK